MKNMRPFKSKNKNYKKVKISSTQKESKRRKNLESSIYISHNIIIFLKIILLIIFTYYSFSLYSKEKLPQKISESEFNEMKSYIQANSNISLDEIYSYRQLCRDKKYIEENPNFQKSENPIITVIITMHNQAHCIHKC